MGIEPNLKLLYFFMLVFLNTAIGDTQETKREYFLLLGNIPQVLDYKKNWESLVDLHRYGTQLCVQSNEKIGIQTVIYGVV